MHNFSATPGTARLPRRMVAAGLAMATAAAVLVGCAPSASEGDDDDVLAIRVAFTTNSVARLQTARALDLFAEHGLDVEFLKFDSGGAANAAYASGGVDIGLMGTPGLLSSRAAGADTQWFLLESDNSPSQKLMASESSGIESVADLRGMRIGTAVGTTGYIGTVLALREEGIDLGEVTIANLPPSSWVSAMDHDEVDAVFGWEPLTYRLEGEGAVEVATLADYTPNFDIWVGRREFLDSDDGQEATRRFIAALDEAEAAFEEDPQRTVDFLAQENSLEPQWVSGAIDEIIRIPYGAQLDPGFEFSMTDDGNAFAVVEQYLGILMETGVFPDQPSIEELFNTAPLQAYMDGAS